MKIKERIKTTSFWAGLIGTVILILSAFGVEVGDDTASAVINAVCSVLAVFGIVRIPDGVKPAEQDVCTDDEVEVFTDDVTDSRS